MSNKIYYWVDGQVVEREWGMRDAVIYGAPCVDMDDEPEQRYGMFRETGAMRWARLKLEDLPPAFRANLLILGVPI